MASKVIISRFLAILIFVFIFNGAESNKFRKKEGASKLRNSKFKTAKTTYGDIYDCVDVHKQPGFDHSALNSHNVKMRPSMQLQHTLANFSSKKSDASFVPENIWLGKGCRPGTVPIRRTTQKHSQDAAYASQKPKKYSHDTAYASPELRKDAHVSEKFHTDRLDFAGIVAAKSPGKRYLGASAYINIYNPKVGPQQFSSASIIIESGDGSNLNQIQVGWTVNPKLYGDGRTRLYTSWTADNHQTTGCYNNLCDGFVIIGHDIPIDFAFPKISSVEGQQFDVGLRVTKDNTTGDWWLFHDNDQAIGYWKKEVFTSLAQGADTIRFGGQVFTPATDDVSPPMGSGIFENGQYQKTCYMRQVSIANEVTKFDPPDDSSIQTVDSRCYYEGDNSYQTDPKWGYRFLFGGAGGKDGSTCVH